MKSWNNLEIEYNLIIESYSQWSQLKHVILHNFFFEKTFPNMKFDLKEIYILPHITTINTYLRSFHHNIVNNFLFLNKKLFVFQMKSTPLCSFCNKEEETLIRIFSEYTYVIYLWQLLATFF